MFHLHYIRIKIAWFALLLLALVAWGCKKEKALEPSNLDENYLVVKDNPNDPVDHSIFQFYEKTGIPCFYNDTIHRKQVGDSAGIPRYFYTRLSLVYSLLGSGTGSFTLLQNKQHIPALLDLLQQELIPQLPDSIFIPSILLVDSFWASLPRIKILPADGWDSYRGFNTVAVKVRDVETMSAEEKKLYVTSIITGLMVKPLIASQRVRLQKEFFSISRDITRAEINDDIYNTFDISYIYANIPPPEALAFFRYIDTYLSFDGVEYFFRYAPREEDDIRAFLVAVLQYNTQTFNTKYADYPAIIEKFRIMKEMARAIGLQLPD